jgi:Zn-dependent protease with chaperone function
MGYSDQRIRAQLNQLEHEARHHPRRHAVRLTLWVMLGFAYPLAVLLLSFAAVVGMTLLGPAAIRSEAAVFWVIGESVIILLMVAVVRAFRFELPEPDGHPLQPSEAPALRALVQDAIAASRQPIVVDHIRIDGAFNAFASQRRRFGLWGRRTNSIGIGLPLMMALTPDEIRSVLAHELGHLYRRHSSFGAWIYRVFQLWQALSIPWGRTRAWRRVFVGWFTRWYAQRLTTTTLPQRRLHEYAADQTSVQNVGAAITASALMQTSLHGYRLEKQFWPAVYRGTQTDPLPPTDIMAMLAETIAAPVPPVLLERWHRAQRRARTPITEEHPCLQDRLQAIDQAPALDCPQRLMRDGGGAAIHLLGDAAPKLLAIANALWKTENISQWRAMHAMAKYEREHAAHHPAHPIRDGSADAAWQPLQTELPSLPAEEAIRRLRAFLADHPDHAAASFELGRLLLDQDDDAAAAVFETAMSRSSEFIAPSLSLLLDYYRSAGRDAEAAPIAQRLETLERDMIAARAERSRVMRRDRFEAHDLTPEALAKVRRILHRYPSVIDAYLVKKRVKHFSDQPAYVLAVHRRVRSMEDRSRADKALIASLAANMEFPCAACILKWSTPRLAGRILKACPSPIYTPMR